MSVLIVHSTENGPQVTPPQALAKFRAFMRMHDRERIDLLAHCRRVGEHFKLQTGLVARQLDGISWEGVPEMGGWPRWRNPPVDWQKTGWLPPPESE